MTLKPGTFLGQFEVLGHIGSGGMGEVYHAKDSKLNRDVAIKVLPEQFVRDPERIARFRREAQVLASLDHPNIARIYAFEETGSARFLVMEYVPGDTLRERIKRGPTPVEESLDISKQIASALEAAHEKTIVHRDLKPANVKVTPEGQVKVLDFGLAKAFAEEPPTDPSESPTVSAMTRPGVILGTAAYMSPEQARGKTVDKRTDIWALGCVLYELLTGKHTFPGEDVTDILGAVLHKEPDWQALPESTPATIRALLRRCLQKDLQKRPKDAGDLRIEMGETQAASATTLPAAASAISPPTGWRRMLLPVAASAVVTAVIASLAAWNLKPAPPRPVTRSTLTLPATERLGATGQGLNWPSVALSPDGTHLAYVAVRDGIQQLFLRAMDQLESRPIPGTEDAWDPFFSPDGQWGVGFFAGGQLKKVSISGGAPLTLCDAPVDRGGSWGPNDTIVFTPTNQSGLMQVSAAGGTPQELTTLQEGERSHRWPEFLPDGKAVLFTVGTATGWKNQQTVVQSLETGERRALIPGATYARYVPTGHLVYVQSTTPGTLLAVPFDLSRLEVTGAPFPVIEGVMMAPNNYSAQFSVSSLGSLVYVSGTPQTVENALVWVDRQGAVEQLVEPRNNYRDPRLSPDGRRLAVRIIGTSTDIWVYDIPRGTLTRLTFEGNNNNHPIWTPDGERITFRSKRAGAPFNLFWKPADGSGVAERLTTSENTQMPTSWSPDGQVLAFFERPATGVGASTPNRDMWVLPLEGERKPRPFLQTPFEEAWAVFSPEGRWLAYMSTESGRQEIYVQPFPGPGGKSQISAEGGREGVWAHTGELFYRNGNQMMVVEITTDPTFSAGTPQVLFEGDFQRGNLSNANYDVSPDGQRFVMIQEGASDSAPPQINVVLNWFEELKQRVPVQ